MPSREELQGEWLTYVSREAELRIAAAQQLASAADILARLAALIESELSPKPQAPEAS